MHLTCKCWKLNPCYCFPLVRENISSLIHLGPCLHLCSIYLVILKFDCTAALMLTNWQKLLLHNPFILTLSEVGQAKDEVIPKNVQQFSASISCCLFFWHICTCSPFHITIATWRFQKTFTGKPKVLMRDKVTFSCLSLIWGHSEAMDVLFW